MAGKYLLGGSEIAIDVRGARSRGRYFTAARERRVSAGSAQGQDGSQVYPAATARAAHLEADGARARLAPVAGEEDDVRLMVRRIQVDVRRQFTVDVHVGLAPAGPARPDQRHGPAGETEGHTAAGEPRVAH